MPHTECAFSEQAHGIRDVDFSLILVLEKRHPANLVKPLFRQIEQHARSDEHHNARGLLNYLQDEWCRGQQVFVIVQNE